MTSGHSSLKPTLAITIRYVSDRVSWRPAARHHREPRVNDVGSDCRHDWAAFGACSGIHGPLTVQICAVIYHTWRRIRWRPLMTRHPLAATGRRLLRIHLDQQEISRTASDRHVHSAFVAIIRLYADRCCAGDTNRAVARLSPFNPIVFEPHRRNTFPVIVASGARKSIVPVLRYASILYRC